MLRLPTFVELAAMPDAYLDETRDLLSRDRCAIIGYGRVKTKSDRSEVAEKNQ